MIKRNFLIGIVAMTTLCFSLNTVNAQAKTSKTKAVKATPLTRYEPSPSHPFGTLNPKAPPETAQFAFMTGNFECISKLPKKDGKWTSSRVIWNSYYFLNGSGIQDKFWGPNTVASGTRIFDKKKGKWIVNYFQTFPGYFAGVWEGKKEGNKMIMRAARGKNESRLTFFDITKGGFDWVGETVTPDGKAISFWKISCKRAR